MLTKIRARIEIEIEIEETEHRHERNVPSSIVLDFGGEQLPGPTNPNATIPNGGSDTATPKYLDKFGNVCLQADGVTPIPVSSPTFTVSTPDTTITLNADGTVTVDELASSTPGEVSTITITDSAGLTGTSIVTEGPAVGTNVPASVALDFVSPT